jgi:flagellar M-ring protein FliF
MLGKVIGQGKVIAGVNATIDFKQIEKTEERYDPENMAIRSEQTAEETYQGSSIRPEGVPGAMSNIPGAGAAGSTRDLKDSSRKKSETINYEVGWVRSRIVEPTGTIKRLSVAVILDGVYERAAGKEGKETLAYKPRTPEEMKKYAEIVKGAVGFNTDRGDQVEVKNIPFERMGFEDEMTKPESGFNLKSAMPFIKQAGTGVLFLFFLLFVVRPFLKNLMSLRSTGMQAQLAGGMGAMTAGAELPGETPPVALDLPKKKETELIDMAKKEPEQFAALMRSWLQSS